MKSVCSYKSPPQRFDVTCTIAHDQNTKIEYQLSKGKAYRAIMVLGYTEPIGYKPTEQTNKTKLKMRILCALQVTTMAQFNKNTRLIQQRPCTKGILSFKNLF